VLIIARDIENPVLPKAILTTGRKVAAARRSWRSVTFSCQIKSRANINIYKQNAATSTTISAAITQTNQKEESSTTAAAGTYEDMGISHLGSICAHIVSLATCRSICYDFDLTTGRRQHHIYYY
jgi:hypothetical protein